LSFTQYNPSHHSDLLHGTRPQSLEMDSMSATGQLPLNCCTTTIGKNARIFTHVTPVLHCAYLCYEDMERGCAKRLSTT